MKTIGLLGGMSWESTVSYYQEINRGINHACGGLHSAKIILYSVDFDPIEKLQHRGDWQGTAEILAEAAGCVEAAGADFLLLCTNTMHKVVPQIEQSIHIPLLHIADATAEVLVKNSIRTVGLIGTAFTMEHDFYTGRLSEKYGLHVLIPEESDRKIVHAVIYDELCHGAVNEASKKEYCRIVEDLEASGAEAVILGCTEIALLLKQSDTAIPLYDTTAIHAACAVRKALE